LESGVSRMPLLSILDIITNDPVNVKNRLWVKTCLSQGHLPINGDREVLSLIQSASIFVTNTQILLTWMLIACPCDWFLLPARCTFGADRMANSADLR
jgi:hypothetical protein